MTQDEVLRDLWTASWMSKGEPPNDKDKAQWWAYSPSLLERGPQINHRSPVFPDFDAGRAYQMDRMLGFRSGGADIPPYGLWASPQTPFFSPVPPYPGDAQQEPPPPIQNPPVMTENGTLDDRLARIEALLAKVAAQGAERLNIMDGKMETLLRSPQVGTVSVPYLGSGKITLQPIVK